MLKNHYGLRLLQGYGHMLSIIRNEHQLHQRRSLLTHNSGLCTGNEK
jgi:hypothetical protein